MLTDEMLRTAAAEADLRYLRFSPGHHGTGARLFCPV